MAEKILLAEDDKALREGLVEVLTKERGFEVNAVADGASAEAEALKGGYALIILDGLMPKKQGLAVAETLKTNGIPTPVMVITGVYKSPAQAKDAKERLGVKEYLLKPFEAEQFLASVDAAMGKQQATRSSPTQAPVQQEPLPERASTQDFPVGMVMFRAQAERHSGILDVGAVNGERTRLFFYRGALVMAQSSREGRHVGTELIRQGVLSAETLRLAISEVGKSSVGLAKALQNLQLVDDAKLKEAYKVLVPQIGVDAVGIVGRFKWTPTEAFAKLIPAVSVSVLPVLLDGLKATSVENVEKLLEKKKTARLQRGPSFDRFNPAIEKALGAEASRAINGRARMGQIVEAAQNPDARKARLLQVHALLCTLSATVVPEDAAAVSTSSPSAAPIDMPEPMPMPEPARAPTPMPQPAAAASSPPRPATNPAMSAVRPPAPAPQPAPPPRPAPAPMPGSAPLPGAAPRAATTSGVQVSRAPAPMPGSAPAQPAAPRAAAMPTNVSPEIKAILVEVEQRFAAMQEQTHFEVLGVSPTDDVGAIKKAYFALAGKFHADKFSGVDLGGMKEKLDAVFARISVASETLTKPDKRAEYDAEMKLKAAGVTTNLGAIFEAESQFAKAEMVLQRGDFIAAKKLLDRVLELDPKDHYRIWHAYVSFRAGGARQDQAADVIRLLEDLGKKTAEPRLNEFLGMVAKSGEDWKNAKKYFRRIKEDPAGNKQLADRELALVDKKLAEAEAKAKGAGGIMGKLFKS